MISNIIIVDSVIEVEKKNLLKTIIEHSSMSMLMHYAYSLPIPPLDDCCITTYNVLYPCDALTVDTSFQLYVFSLKQQF